ncbi:YitT family protein [Neobacillus sp. D3-1R]|uniref:YitT family protein n=1 Tax=Neobacillus sp. D3-1R TaxID=3445778 RepID=UPI003FA0DDD9
MKRIGKFYPLLIFIFLYVNVFILFSLLYLLLDFLGLGSLKEEVSTSKQHVLFPEKVIRAFHFSATTFISHGYSEIKPVGWSKAIAFMEETIGFLVPAFIMVKFFSLENEKLVRSRMSPSQFIIRAFFILIGALFVSLGLEFFLVPNKIIDGGIVGVSIIMSYLTGFKLEFFLLILNLPFLYLGYRQFGKKFLVMTLLGITLLSLVTFFLYNVPVPTDNPFLASIMGGALLGIGVGMVIRSGGSLDGTEIIGIFVNKRTSFSIGKVVMFINVFIFCCAGFVFGWDKAMFSLIAYYIASYMIDFTVGAFQK